MISDQKPQKATLEIHIHFSGQPAHATSPYLGQGERRLLAGAAPYPELSWLHSLTGAFAVDKKAVVGWSTCWEKEKAEEVANQC